MEFGITFFIISVLIIAIWIFIEVKRLRHKIFAIFLIVLILFSYVSFLAVLKGHSEIDLKTAPGLVEAGKVYLAWMGNIFENVKTVTAQVIKMDWSANEVIK